MRFRYLLVLAPFLAGELPGQQAPDTVRHVTLGTITVTARRYGVPTPPTTVIEAPGAQLARVGSTDVYDAVRRVAGLEIHDQGQGPGYAPNVPLRGFTSDHGSDVLILLDGVPLNLPVHGHIEGYADWSVVPLRFLSGIQVTSGPASPIYGDFALGGVLEATTLAPGTGNTATMEISTVGNLTGAARWSRGTSMQGFAANLEGGYRSGWRDHSGSWLGVLNLRGRTGVGSWIVDGGVAAYGSEWDSPGFLSVAEYNAGDLKGAADTTDGGRSNRTILNARFLRAGTKVSTTLAMWTQFTDTRSWLGIPDDGVLQQQEEWEERVALGMRAEVSWSSAAGLPLLGLELRRDAGQYQRYQTELRVREDAEANRDADLVGASGYARWTPTLGTRVGLDFGLRVDALEPGMTDHLDSERAVSVWHTIVAPKLGARLDVSRVVTASLSIARGFKGAPGTLDDPARPPVTAWSGEAAIEASWSRARIRVAGFHQDVHNERIQDPVSLLISDAGTSVRNGLNLDASWTPSGRFMLFSDLTVNDAHISSVQEMPVLAFRREGGDAPVPLFHDVPLEPGDPVPGVAKYWGRVGIEGTWKSTVATAAVRFSGPFTPIGEPNVETSSYAVADVSIGTTLSSAVSLDVGLRNVFDTRFPEIRASGFVNPGAPRTLLLGVRAHRPTL